jgi:hypothetical protein
MNFIDDKSNRQEGDCLSSMNKIRDDINLSTEKNVSMKDMFDLTRNAGGDMVLVAALSLAIILPLGAVPGVPAIAGIALSLLFLNELLWFYEFKIPAVASKVRVSRHVALKVFSGIDRCFSKVGEHAHEDRLSFLNSGLSIRIIAVLGLMLSVSMILLGFIPFVPTLLMMPVLMFSIGLIVKDGLFVAFGYLSVLILAVLVFLVMI